MELQAPSRWRCADFISDLHLHAADSATFAAWAAYMRSTSADAVFILGDLFEVWVGDDAAYVKNSFESQCVAVLRETAARLALFIMQGNRDFLIGPDLMAQSQATALPDPTTLTFGGQRWLLSHGDALCVDDTEYQTFRRQVRSAAWQQSFLAQSLERRQAIARGIRETSESRKQGATAYADVDAAAARALLDANQAIQLIHGHTHKPGQHPLAAGRVRTVLSDWDANAKPPRVEVVRLSLHTDGTASMTRLPSASA
jgi:UDP-2,3-diacylglucosamine hydrolase